MELNGCTIEAFRPNHIDAYRALEDLNPILIGEGDFFRKSEQEVRALAIIVGNVRSLLN